MTLLKYSIYSIDFKGNSQTFREYFCLLFSWLFLKVSNDINNDILFIYTLNDCKWTFTWNDLEQLMNLNHNITISIAKSHRFWITKLPDTKWNMALDIFLCYQKISGRDGCHFSKHTRCIKYIRNTDAVQDSYDMSHIEFSKISRRYINYRSAADRRSGLIVSLIQSM